MVFKIPKDYALLAIGATFGLLVGALCNVAAEADCCAEKCKEENL